MSSKSALVEAGVVYVVLHIMSGGYSESFEGYGTAPSARNITPTTVSQRCIELYLEAC